MSSTTAGTAVTKPPFILDALKRSDSEDAKNYHSKNSQPQTFDIQQDKENTEVLQASNNKLQDLNIESLVEN